MPTPATCLLAALLFAFQATAPREQACEGGSFPAQWINGLPDCSSEPYMQVHAYNPDFYILRQSVCTHYEAPFLYLIFGSDKALLLDTGSAPPFSVQAEVADVVRNWLDVHNRTSIELVVAHTHAHGDHVGGDAQFQGQPDTTFVAPGVESNVAFFGFQDWPMQNATFDLGGRVIDLIPIPGHENSSIAFYDRRTCILMTGDSLYPGRLYVPGAVSEGQWEVYRRSMRKLLDFSAVNPVSWVLGCHIEMTQRHGVDFPFAAPTHPLEHVLQLTTEHLQQLVATLEPLDPPAITPLRDFIIYPIN